MAVVTFDTLKCARRLMAAGMTEELATAQAEVMAETFVTNIDNLVTRDYLQTCLQSLEDRQAARFAEIAGNFRLMFWILAAISATTVIPALHRLFNGTLPGI